MTTERENEPREAAPARGYAAQLREAARLLVEVGQEHTARSLADALGVSRSRASDLLRELRECGAIVSVPRRSHRGRKLVYRRTS